MMYAGHARSYEKADFMDSFTVLFTGGNVVLGDKSFPLGQITADVLNMNQQDIIDLTVESANFAGHTKRKLMNPEIEKNPALFSEIEENFSKVLDRVAVLPMYRDLRIKWYEILGVLPQAYANFPEAICTAGTIENLSMEDFLGHFGRIGFELSTFWTYVRMMLDVYFEPLSKRSSEAYAVAMYHFFAGTDILNKISQELPQSPAFVFLQSSQVQLEYVPMPDPEDITHYLIAERVVFQSIGEFLRTDFFRALQHGNAPRRCHNCEKFFLLTAGYNTCYCNNIAPGETERTCRKVGAHRKAEAKEKTPAQMEYDRVYNRLKQQKSRGKISVDDWNTAVAQALEVKDRAERGELSDEEMKVALEGMGRR